MSPFASLVDVFDGGNAVPWIDITGYNLASNGADFFCQAGAIFFPCFIRINLDGVELCVFSH
jgi:hypothetical protein